MEDFELKIKIDDKDIQKAKPTLKDLRQQLKDIQNEMAGLDEGSEAFLEAANRAGTLKHQLDEIRESTRGASADFGDMLGNITAASAGIVGSFQAIQGAMNLLGVESEEVTKSIQTMQSMMAITQGLASIDNGVKALDKLRNAITGATVAAKAFRAALTPKVVLAVVAAVTALVYAYEKLTKASREAAKAKEEEIKKAKEAADAYNNQVGKAASALLVTFEKLRVEYGKLGTQAEKQKWIADNKNELNKLGLAINNINDAENFLVKNSAKVIQAFSLRAQAAANESLAAEQYQKYYAKKSAISTNNPGFRTMDTPELQKLKATADSYIQAAAELRLQADELVNTGNKQTEKQTETIKKNAKTAKELIKEWYDLEVARLNLSKEQNQADVEGVKYFEKLKEIQQAYRDKMSDISGVTELELTNIDIAIAKTNNEIQNFGKSDEESGLTEFEQKLQEIETALSKINYEFEASEQNANDELTRLEQIIEKEKERLDLLEQNGEIGTKAWYDQKLAIAEYENELKNVKKSTANYSELAGNVSKVTAAGFSAVGDILNGLADQQDDQTKEGFERAKKMNIASATMSMLSGLVEILAGTFTTHSGVWDYILAGIQAAAVLAAGTLNIQKIKNQTFDNASATGASASLSTAAVNNITAPVQFTQDIQGAELMGEIKNQKVYVTETDLRNTNQKVSIQEQENTY